MADYRRYRVPGGIYFFTINPLERRAYLPVRHIELLREAVITRAERPFYIDAWVVLPEFHALRNCPTTGDDAFSDRTKAIKSRFVQATNCEG